MSYRPICDTWILARSKVKYYGAYPSGFLGRARALLGVGAEDPVLHVCAGRVRDYPFAGLGRQDVTLDADAETQPDILCDVASEGIPSTPGGWPAILIDPPYTEEDHQKYRVGGEVALPSPSALLRSALAVVRPGGRVGMLHYLIPRPPKTAKFVACVGVIVGFGNRGRFYTVFERPA